MFWYLQEVKTERTSSKAKDKKGFSLVLYKFSFNLISSLAHLAFVFLTICLSTCVFPPSVDYISCSRTLL